MDYELDIKANAIDSLNEALSCYEKGEKGDIKAYKFAILHLSHFLELLLKIYVSSLDVNLIFTKCFQHVVTRAKKDKSTLLEAVEKLRKEEFDFNSLIATIPSPHTISLDQAMDLAKCEKCGQTGVKFVGTDFSDDVAWIKGLRNNIEHFEFKLTPKEVRLTIGRLIRSTIEFLDIFELFNLENEIGKENLHLFTILADEYAHQLAEAKLEVREQEAETFRGVRPKHYAFIEWNVYSCPECSNQTLIPNKDSKTGYRCTACKNEDSGEIDVPCDCCGAQAPSEEMEVWKIDDNTVEYRCYYCTGNYYANKAD